MGTSRGGIEPVEHCKWAGKEREEEQEQKRGQKRGQKREKKTETETERRRRRRCVKNQTPENATPP